MAILLYRLERRFRYRTTQQRMSQSSKIRIAGVYEEYRTALVRFISNRFQNTDDADDIAQEAYIRLQRLERPENITDTRAYLFQTASNIAIDQLRRRDLHRSWQQAEQSADASGRQESPPPEQALAAAQQIEQVYAALDELPYKCRQVFLLHRIRDMTYPEIAREMGISTSSVEKYIIQALRHFRERLEQG